MKAVRKMEASDLDAVLEIEKNELQAPHWSRNEYQLCLGAGLDGSLRRAAFVAESGCGLLGFAVAKMVTGICELESIVVRKEARRQGAGAALIGTVMDWAADAGAIRLELEVRASNTAAICLYRRAGMRPEGLRRRYYRHPEEDAVLMGASLPPGGKLP